MPDSLTRPGSLSTLDVGHPRARGQRLVLFSFASRPRSELMDTREGGGARHVRRPRGGSMKKRAAGRKRGGQEKMPCMPCRGQTEKTGRQRDKRALTTFCPACKTTFALPHGCTSRLLFHALQPFPALFFLTYCPQTTFQTSGQAQKCEQKGRDG